MVMRRGGFALFMFIAAASSASCGGPGAVAGAVRPAEPTLPPEVCDIAAPTQDPLIVDMPAEQRGDVEIAMQEGVAVVQYDCKSFKILRDCKIAGTYGFKGMQTKERVLRIDNADEVRFNLPTFGLSMPVSLKSELSRGSTLDIALVMIGKRRTTWLEASKGDLKGSCEGATHFVRGATLGAFAMKKGARAQASTVAQVFSTSASGASSSQKATENRDGSLEACGKAGPDDKSPPSQCRAPVRLELSALKAKTTTEVKRPAEEPVAEAVLSDCATGLVRTADGLCAKPTAGRVHTCGPKDASDCREQCDHGDGASCNNLGVMTVLGDGASKDEKLAAELFDKACKAGDGQGCVNVAKAWLAGRGVARDPNRAAESMKRACDLAFAPACTKLGLLYSFGVGATKNDGRAAQLFAEGCDAGDKLGCTLLGERYARGVAVVQSLARALELYQRACDGGDLDGCGNLGDAYEQGRGVAKSLRRAIELYQKACDAGGASGCGGLASIFEMGAKGDGLDIAADERKAIAYYERAYLLAPVESVAAILNVLYGQTKPMDRERVQALVPSLDQQCAAGSGEHCGHAGILKTALGEREPGARDLRRACELKDEWSCFVVKRLKL